MKCKTCGRNLTFGIDPDEYLVFSMSGREKEVKEGYYHEYNVSLMDLIFCDNAEPDYKFKDYIKRCKRNARSVKNL